MIYRLVQDYLRHSWVGSGSFRLLIVWSTGSIRSVQVDSGLGSCQFRSIQSSVQVDSLVCSARLARLSSVQLASSRFKVGSAQVQVESGFVATHFRSFLL